MGVVGSWKPIFQELVWSFKHNSESWKVKKTNKATIKNTKDTLNLRNEESDIDLIEGIAKKRWVKEVIYGEKIEWRDFINLGVLLLLKAKYIK